MEIVIGISSGLITVALLEWLLHVAESRRWQRFLSDEDARLLARFGDLDTPAYLRKRSE